MAELLEGYEAPAPGTMKRKYKGNIAFYPIVRQTIFGDKMRTTLNTPCLTRGKARWVATKYVRNL